MQHLPTVPSLPIGNVNPGVIRFVDQLVELDLSGLLQLYNPIEHTEQLECERVAF